MRRLLRHFATVTLPKIVGILLLLAGIPDRPVAFIGVTYVTWRGVVTLRAGWREQYIEPLWHQMARHMRDLVWDNTRWLNWRGARLETPAEGIERLAVPFEGEARGTLSAALAAPDVPVAHAGQLDSPVQVLASGAALRVAAHPVPPSHAGLIRGPWKEHHASRVRAASRRDVRAVVGSPRHNPAGEQPRQLRAPHELPVR